MESTYVGKRKKLKLFSDNLVISGDQSISNCEGIRKGLHLFEIDPTIPLFLSSEKPLLENIVMRKHWCLIGSSLPNYYPNATIFLQGALQISHVLFWYIWTKKVDAPLGSGRTSKVAVA